MKISIILLVAFTATLIPNYATADEEAVAKSAYRKGRIHFKAGRFKQAVDELERAYVEASAVELWSNLDQEQATLSVSFGATALAKTSLEE